MNSITNDQLARVRRRMSMLANELVGRLGPMDVVGSMMGAALGVLETTYGQAKAVKYVRELADELEKDEDLPIGPTVGRA